MFGNSDRSRRVGSGDSRQQRLHEGGGSAGIPFRSAPSRRRLDPLLLLDLWRARLQALRRAFGAQRTLDEVQGHLQDHPGVMAMRAVELTERCAELTITIKALEKEITELTTQLAPALLPLPGCGALTAAKIIGKTADVDRFKSRDSTRVSTEPHRC